MASLALPQTVRGALNYIKSKAPAIARARVKAELGAGRMKDAALILSGGAAVGAAMALAGDPAKRGSIQVSSRFPYPLEAVVPVMGVLGGVVDGFGKHSDDAVLFFAGALAPFMKDQAHLRIAAMRSGVSVSGMPFAESSLFDPEIDG